MKTAKVLAFYFGDRRHYPNNKQGTIELLKRQILNHQTIDPGVEQDLIIVNHDKGEEDIKTLLDEYNGQEVFNGKIKIIHRPRINSDLSFGSYKYAFHLLQNEYDYFFFCEDDIEVLKKDVTKKMINILDKNKKIGFVAALDFIKQNYHTFKLEKGYIIKTGNLEPHAHGGVGLTSTVKMKQVADTIPSYLSIPNILNLSQTYIDEEGYSGENEYEINFTNDFIKAGFKIKPLPVEDNFLHIRENIIL